MHTLLGMHLSLPHALIGWHNFLTFHGDCFIIFILLIEKFWGNFNQLCFSYPIDWDVLLIFKASKELISS